MAKGMQLANHPQDRHAMAQTSSSSRKASGVEHRLT